MISILRESLRDPELRKQFVQKKTVRKYVLEMKEDGNPGAIGAEFAKVVGVDPKDVLVLEGCSLHVVDLEVLADE